MLTAANLKSPPMWRRGLKPEKLGLEVYDVLVASHVEAWIETSSTPSAITSRRSPPMWRRGLKRPEDAGGSRSTGSPPMWRRGLKQSSSRSQHDHQEVASHVEAWIETGWEKTCSSSIMSPPMWRRGLKHFIHPQPTIGDRSPPMWRRGLKLFL